jgi:hypothetical protein
MFSVMWSEHCSYKSSRPAPSTLPTAEPGVVAGPGENAGVISIGDGLAVAFKIESHQPPERGRAVPGRGDRRWRHPARHLHDGRPADRGTRRVALRRPGLARDAATSSTAWSGASAAMATASACRRSAGSSSSTTSYAGNPLVNVMAIGLLEERLLTRAAAPGPGNLAVLFGSATGRDGIGGRSVLAQRHLQRRRSLQAPLRPGRGSIRREAADRGQPRAHRARSRRGPPGPRRGRDHLRDVRDRGPWRDRDRDRPRGDPAPRAGSRTLRGHDLGVPGADVRGRATGALAGRPRGVHSLGVAGRRHRWRHGRRRDHGQERHRRARPRSPRAR